MDRDRTKAALAAQAAELEAKQVELERELAAVKAELEEERARRIAAEQVALRMKRDIERLERQLMGPKSERLIDPNEQPIPDPAEGEDGEEAEQAPDDEDQDEESSEADRPKKRRKKRRKGGRRRVADMNDLRTVEHRSEASEQLCPCGCGARGHCIGEDVSWRLDYTPAELFRIKTVREKAAFPDHEGPLQSTVVAPPPTTISFALPRAMCGNVLVAQIAIDKYADHLPLFRQERRFERLGASIARSTMCDWLMALAGHLRPIWKYMNREVLAGTWLRADASPTSRSRTCAPG